MELQQQLAEANRLLAQATAKPKSDAEKAKAGFKVPKGEEELLHVYVTHKNGVPVDKPQVEPYHPNVYASVSAQGTGFQGEIIHDPRKK